MTDSWTDSNGDSLPSDWTPGGPLTPAGDWSSSCGCAPPDGPAIADSITINGSPGSITSVQNGKSLWSLVLNDGTPEADFRIDRFDNAGLLADSPMSIVRATGVVSFNDPVMLAEDPLEDMEAATKRYVDENASGIPDAPMDQQTYGRDMGQWVALPGSYMPEAPNTTQIFGRFNSTWALVPIQADAPSDGATYGRANGAWNAALALTGGTITGNLTVNQVLTVQGSNSLVLNAAGGNQRAILGQTSGLTRWQMMLGDQTAEGLGAVGSNFSLSAYNNTGGFLGNWLTIARADGSTTFNGPVNMNNGAAVNGTLALQGPGSFYLPGGSAGQVLTTNGAAALSWATPSGGGGTSITVGDTPPSSPAVGALWWDSVGGQLYVWYADANSSQWVIAVNAASAGGASISIGATPPLSPSVGALWFDASSAQLYVWYNDGNSSQWVPTSNQMGGGYLPLSGGTLTGPLTGPQATLTGTGPALILAGPTVPNGAYFTGTIVGATRWLVALGNGAAEAGSNVGSDFEIDAYTDAGSYLNQALVITRANASVAIRGVNNASPVGPGWVGEVISSLVTTGITLTNNVAVNITSISLTPGDWDVQGEVWITGASAATSFTGAINTVSATVPPTIALNTARTQVGGTLSAANLLALSPCRASLAVATTYYLIASCVFTAGTVLTTGKIWARRAR